MYHDGTASSLRNRAMLLLLARLGLRAQDVITLCFDDIDWADGRLDLRPGKTRRARSLPLPHDVGQAIVAYLQGGRPRSAQSPGLSALSAAVSAVDQQRGLVDGAASVRSMLASSSPLASRAISSGIPPPPRWSTMARASKTWPMSWAISPSRPRVSTPSWSSTLWRPSPCRGEEGRYEHRLFRDPAGGLSEPARSARIPDACRENPPARVRGVRESARDHRSNPCPAGLRVGLPGHPRHAARAVPRDASVWHGGFSSTSRPLCQTPRCQTQVCCQPHDDRNPTSSRHRSSRPSWRPRRRVVRVDRYAPTPYPPCSVCWPAPVCGWARRSAYRSMHVKLELHPPQLHILETKFHKSRIVPLHPSTAEQPAPLSVSSERACTTMGYQTPFSCLNRDSPCSIWPSTTGLLGCASAWPSSRPSGGRSPCLMSFRHTFAVTCVQRWYQQGLDVQALLPHLSVYLGHVRPARKLLVPHGGAGVAERRGTAIPGLCHGRR